MEKSKETLIKQLLKFRKERTWEQFHTAKSLAISISIETSELLSIFQWIKDDKLEEYIKEKFADIKDEIADIYIYLSFLAYDLGIDLEEVAKEKMILNAKRYPISKAKDSSKKYTEL